MLQLRSWAPCPYLDAGVPLHSEFAPTVRRLIQTARWHVEPDTFRRSFHRPPGCEAQCRSDSILSLPAERQLHLPINDN